MSSKVSHLIKKKINRKQIKPYLEETHLNQSRNLKIKVREDITNTNEKKKICRRVIAFNVITIR